MFHAVRQVYIYNCIVLRYSEIKHVRMCLYVFMSLYVIIGQLLVCRDVIREW
jgi:hypothetical protein